MKNYETFTQAQMEILQTANEGVKGTENYYIFQIVSRFFADFCNK